MDLPAIQLHYYLADGAHAMNAHVRNKCEAEMLAAIQYVLEQLAIDVQIETSAYTEGGLIEHWRFVTKPENAAVGITLTLGTLTLLSTILLAVWNHLPASDPELDATNKKIAAATLEEKQLTILKLREELKKAGVPLPPSQTLTVKAIDASPTSSGALVVAPKASDPSKPPVVRARTVDRAPNLSMVGPGPSPEIVDAAVAVLRVDLKVATRRSNFFKAVLPYDKVLAIGFTPASSADAVPTEQVVERGNFSKYLLTSDKLPSDVVDGAIIEIVAPVIKEGGMQWKGIYNGESISFAMKDEAFKAMVKRREVSFYAGNAISCVLQIDKKVDSLGDVVVTGYSVPTVLAKVESDALVETPQGRRHKFEQKHAKSQNGLFDFPDDSQP